MTQEVTTGNSKRIQPVKACSNYLKFLLVDPAQPAVTPVLNKLLQQTGSQRPQRSCPLANKVDHINYRQVWPCWSMTPFPWEDVGPHLTCNSLGPQSQRPKQHLNWLSRFAGLTVRNSCIHILTSTPIHTWCSSAKSLLSTVILSTNITNKTHTHPFNSPFPGLLGWAGTRKVKPIWI